MTLKELKYIVTIAEEKSISKAAEKLYISQPSLSQCLLRVEKQCGTNLFNRTNKGLVLTYTGTKYVETALKILSLYNNFENDLLDINNMRKGQLTIGTTVHLGSIILPTVLPIYQKLYPNIEITIQEGSSKQIEDQIKNAEVDIGLIHYPMQIHGITYIEIKEDPFLAVINKGSHLEQYFYWKNNEKQPYINPTNLSEEKFILAYPYQRVRQISDEILNAAGISPEIFLISSSVQTALSLSSCGLGVTFVPESYISLFNYPNSPTFCSIERKFRAFWTFAVAFLDDKNLSGPSKEFIRILKEEF